MRRIILQGPVGPIIRSGDKDYLYFGGTNYLGMADRPEVRDAAKAAIDRFGLSFSASRTSTGTSELHLQLETALSEFAGTREAVVLSSGYLAMHSLLEGICEKGDFIFLQDTAHPSIRQAVAMTGLPFADFGFDDLAGIESALNRSTSESGRVVVAAEGVAPLTGDILPLPEILNLLRDRPSQVCIDDAHGFGVAGVQGRGTVEYFGVSGVPGVVACGTLSKAFGAFGGCIWGDTVVIEEVRRRSAAYICASPPTAADLGAALAAVRFVIAHPQLIEKLQSNVFTLKNGLSRLGLSVNDNPIPIVPISLESATAMETLTEQLLSKGILAPYLKYPGSPPAGIIRLAVTAAHEKDQIQYLLECLQELI